MVPAVLPAVIHGVRGRKARTILRAIASAIHRPHGALDWLNSRSSAAVHDLRAMHEPVHHLKSATAH
jgi:hypothetical protein